MHPPGELGAAWARSTSEKIRSAAQEVGVGHGDLLERLVRAWPYLRPLYPNAVPGQAGLTDLQRQELQGILDTVGGSWGPGANAPYVRRLKPWEAVKVAAGLRHLAASLSPRPEVVRSA